MKVVTSRSLVADFFAKTLGLHNSDDLRGIIWVPDHLAIPGTPMLSSQVAVAVAFNGFIGKTCCMHTVIQMPELLNRHMIRESFRFAFESCGVQTIFGLVDSHNEAAADFDRRIGFTEFQRIKDGGLEGDLIMFKMDKADCRWLRKVNHGQEERTACA